MKQYVKYYAGLVALFIAVSHGSEMGQLFRQGAAGGSEFTRSLQGR